MVITSNRRGVGSEWSTPSRMSRRVEDCWCFGMGPSRRAAAGSFVEPRPVSSFAVLLQQRFQSVWSREAQRLDQKLEGKRRCRSCRQHPRRRLLRRVRPGRVGECCQLAAGAADLDKDDRVDRVDSVLLPPASRYGKWGRTGIEPERTPALPPCHPRAQEYRRSQSRAWEGGMPWVPEANQAASTIKVSGASRQSQETAPLARGGSGLAGTETGWSGAPLEVV